MKVDLNNVVAKLIEARKQLEEVEFTERGLKEYTEKLKKIVEKLHKDILIYEKGQPFFPHEILDNIFLKLCEIALILHHADEASRIPEEAQSGEE